MACTLRALQPGESIPDARMEPDLVGNPRRTVASAARSCRPCGKKARRDRALTLVRGPVHGLPILKVKIISMGKHARSPASCLGLMESLIPSRPKEVAAVFLDHLEQSGIHRT